MTATTQPSRGRAGTWAALALYVVLAAVLFGRQALAHPSAMAIAPNEVDSSQYQWFLAWWPHALLHGLDPFVTHLVYVPGGYNLTWTTSMAGPALLLSPITLLFGPTVAFNVFGVLAPALSAWAAFLLCRHLTGRTGPALLGGWVFGYSGFELTTTQGEPWLAFAALLPVVVLLALRWTEGRTSSRAFVVWTALAIALQFLTSAESLATATGFGVVVLLIAWVRLADARPALRGLIARLGAAYLAAAVLLSPYLLAMLGPHPIPNQTEAFANAPTDPVALIMPGVAQTRGPWQATQLGRLGLPTAQDSFAFLGLPVVLIVIVFLIRRRRERLAQLLGVVFVAALIAVLGGKLVIAGHATGVPLPWAAVHQLPLLRYALPMRMAVFMALAAALIVALWLARARPGLAALAAVLVVATTLPSLSAPLWHSTAVDPAFFASDTYRHYLRSDDNVLTIPAIGPNERWQARSGFAFRIVGGYLGAFPPAYTRFPAWNALLNGVPTAHWPGDLRTYLAAKHATVIVLDARLGPQWPRLLSGLGIRPQAVGQVLVYRLSGTPPAGRGT